MTGVTCGVNLCGDHHSRNISHNYLHLSTQGHNTDCGIELECLQWKIRVVEWYSKASQLTIPSFMAVFTAPYK
jgi:hypothetical protein